MKKIYIKENIEIKTSNEFVDYSEAMKFMEDRVRKIICNKDCLLYTSDAADE